MKKFVRDCSLWALAATTALLVADAKAQEKAAPKAAVTPSSSVHWIWPTKPATANQKAWFRKEFNFKKSAAVTARLFVAADNEFRLFLNGEQIAAGNEWQSPAFVSVGSKLLEGRNVIAVDAKNDGGNAAALMVKLEIDSGRAVQIIGTDATWKSSEKAPTGWQLPTFDDSSWTKPVVLAQLGGAPWTSVNEKSLQAAANVKPPEATPVERLRVAKGFKVERLYSVPKDEQGSWVSMTVDPKGRLIVSDQYGGLYRLSPPPLASSTGLEIEKIDVPIGEAQGLLWAFDSLYVVVNRGGKYASGVYRVQDTNGDDKLDKVETLRLLEGGGEHGPHAALLSPDGKSIYILAGNHTKPTKFDSSKVPLVYQEDHLLPRMWDARGHARGILAPGGWVASMSPDGKQWELFSMGYRNQYDAAFNTRGELFVYDADMEWDVNTPWYRPTRVNLATSGSEFGWRSGTGKWPDYYPDSLGAVVNIGPGSPTGVVFGYGAKFPAKYQEALYISDWSYGKLYAIHLKPEGAGYVAEKEEFISASPLPLTDMVVNPKDGAFYFAVGGRKTQSGLYRVTYSGPESTAPSKGMPAPPQLAARKKLEAYHGKVDANAVKDAWKALGDSDRYLRFAARTAIEWQPAATWQDKALSEKDPQTALTSLLALSRVGDKAIQPKLLTALDKLDWSKLTDMQRVELLRVYALAFIRMGEPDAATRQKVIAKFDPLFPAQRREVNAELAQMLVYLEAPSAAKKVVSMLTSAPTQEEQIDYARMLRSLKTGWTMDLRKTYFTWFQKAANFKGGNSLGGFIKNFKDEAMLNLNPAELAELKPIIDAKIETKSLMAEFMEGRTFSKEWTLKELAPLVEKQLKKRNFERGRQIYAGVGCASCHRFDSDGGAVGPDLTGVAGRFNPRDLLESILDPNKEISDQFGSVVITLKNGDSYNGRVVNLAGDNMRFNTDMFDPNQSIGIDTRQVESVEPSKTSMMPEGLINLLKDDEVSDLVAFMLSGGNRNHAYFK